MRTVTCDLCGANIGGYVIRIEVLDGEHPHNGSEMTKHIDACASCASELELKCRKEFSELVKVPKSVKRGKR